MFSFDIYGEPSEHREAAQATEPDIATLQGRERRESERVIAYWEKKMTQFGSGVTLAALELVKMRSSAWSHRFVIAVDPMPENSALLYYGADFARLLELPGERTPRVPMAQQFHTRLSGIFTRPTGPPSRFALPGKRAADVPIVKHLPQRFSDVFVRGCGTHRHETPLRMEGEVEREDGRRELYRAAFIPLASNENSPTRLAFGAFSSRIFAPALAA
jgi:hypothetical protein